MCRKAQVETGKRGVRGERQERSRWGRKPNQSCPKDRTGYVCRGTVQAGVRRQERERRVGRHETARQPIPGKENSAKS